MGIGLHLESDGIPSTNTKRRRGAERDGPAPLSNPFLLLGNDLIDEAVFHGFIGRHKIIALTVGRKKVQDLLVDSKVPRDLRSSVLFAAAGNEILWMIGADSGISCAATAKSRFTANYKISQASKKVLILEIGE